MTPKLATCTVQNALSDIRVAKAHRYRREGVSQGLTTSSHLSGASTGQQPSFAADESPLLILKCGVCVCIPVFEAQIDRAPSRTSSVDDAFRNRERLTRS